MQKRFVEWRQMLPPEVTIFNLEEVAEYQRGCSVKRHSTFLVIECYVRLKGEKEIRKLESHLEDKDWFQFKNEHLKFEEALLDFKMATEGEKNERSS